MTQRACALIVLSLLVAFAGCKSKAQKMIDDNRDEVTAALGRVKALAPVVEKQPHLAEANWPVPGVKVGVNAGVIWAHKLTRPCGNMFTTYAMDNSGTAFIVLREVELAEYWFEKPMCALEGNDNRTAGLDQRFIDMLVKMKYALVLRPTVKEVPHLDSDDVLAHVRGRAEKDIMSFVPGRIAGDALLYDLMSGKLVGNFPFDAHSSIELEVHNQWDLVFDLGGQLDAQLQAQLAK